MLHAEGVVAQAPGGGDGVLGVHAPGHVEGEPGALLHGVGDGGVLDARHGGDPSQRPHGDSLTHVGDAEAVALGAALRPRAGTGPAAGGADAGEARGGLVGVEVNGVHDHLAAVGVEAGPGCELAQGGGRGAGDLVVDVLDVRGGAVLAVAAPPQVRLQGGGVVQEVVAGQEALASQRGEGLVDLGVVEVARLTAAECPRFPAEALEVAFVRLVAVPESEEAVDTVPCLLALLTQGTGLGVPPAGDPVHGGGQADAAVGDEVVTGGGDLAREEREEGVDEGLGVGGDVAGERVEPAGRRVRGLSPGAAGAGAARVAPLLEDRPDAAGRRGDGIGDGGVQDVGGELAGEELGGAQVGGRGPHDAVEELSGLLEVGHGAGGGAHDGQDEGVAVTTAGAAHALEVAGGGAGQGGEADHGEVPDVHAELEGGGAGQDVGVRAGVGAGEGLLQLLAALTVQEGSVLPGLDGAQASLGVEGVVVVGALPHPAL